MEEPSSVLPSVIEVKKKRLGDTKFVIGIDDLTISNTTTPQQQQQRQQEQELPPPEGITNNSTEAPLRRPYRQHVKRRISRMHMVKAQNLTDSEAEVDNKNNVTAVDMRRSQSQRSLLPRQQFQPQPRRSLTQQLPFTLDDQQREQQRRNSTNSYNSIRRNSPAHYFVSQQQMAAPIEQTFNAVANNLVAPNGAAYPACVHAASSPVLSLPASPRRRQPAASSSTTTKPLLKSHFIANSCNSKRNKNKYQPQENDEEETPCITRELNRIDSEYQCLKQYRDPMMESFIRCMRIRNDLSNSKRHPPIRSSTYHSSSAHRTISSSATITSNIYTNNDSNLLLHSGHHQITVAARRHQQQRRQQLSMLTAHNNRKNFVSSTTPNKFSPSSSSSSSSPRSEWNKRGGTLSALWDRMMHNVNS